MSSPDTSIALITPSPIHMVRPVGGLDQRVYASRHYWCCSRCGALTVRDVPWRVLVDERAALEIISCPGYQMLNSTDPCAVCTGRVEFRGSVTVHAVRKRVACDAACDARCLLATEPGCSCYCGGLNHGKGRTQFAADLAEVWTRRERGGA